MKTITNDPITKPKGDQFFLTKEELIKEDERRENQKNEGEEEASIDMRNMEGEVFVGTDQDDTFEFFGLYGDDTMIGSEGSDYFNGSYGSDTVDYSGSSEPILVDLDIGAGWFGQADGDRLISVENVIGSEGDDEFIGNEFDNTMEGRGGYDTFYADAGSDTYYGGADGNKLVASGDHMTINLSVGTGSGGVADGDRYYDISDVDISGNNNTITGTMDDNIISINGLDNSVSLLGGNDTLDLLSLDSTHFGTSMFDGGAGFDALDVSGMAIPSSLGLAIDLSNETFQTFRIDDGSTVGGVSEIFNFEDVIGSNAKDVITDNKEDNTFTGNGGADVFRFIHKDSGQDDTITDFTPGEDRIDLSRIEGLGSLTGFDGQGDVEFGEFKIPIENAVEILSDLRDKIDLPSGISFAYQDGDDVVIYTDFAADNTITLQGVDMSAMSFSDFIL